MTDFLVTFRRNMRHVEDLLELDEHILRLPLAKLRSIQRAQERLKHSPHPHTLVTPVVKMLEQVQEHDSLSPKLQAVRNQCVVLVVSYFGSAVREAFIGTIARRLRDGTGTSSLFDSQLTLSLADLLALEEDAPQKVAEALAEKKDISFQDMRSIGRAFDTFLEHKIERTASVNDIIAAQACRHVIVHNGGVIDAALLRQLKGASPRGVLTGLVAGRSIAATDHDVQMAGKAMEEYLERLPI